MNALDSLSQNYYRRGMDHEGLRRARRLIAVEPPPDAERAIRTCPNCGRPLLQRSCKLMCPDPACGFFLSCADYL